MRKDCGDAAETVQKDYRSGADIVRNMGGPAADATSKLVSCPDPALDYVEVHLDMVAQECTPTSRPQRDRPCSALCPQCFRSLKNFRTISATSCLIPP